MNKYIITLLIIVLLYGCATSQPGQESTPPPPPVAEVTNRDSIQSAQFPTGRFATESNVWMKANMKIAFPNLNHSISATIEIAKMDSLLISINAMFGISVGKLFATPTEFIMNNNLDNVTYTGSPTRENLMKVAFMDLSYNDLLCILKCIPTQAPGKYQYKLATNSYTCVAETFIENVYFVDKDVLSKIVRTDRNGNEILTVDYSNHISEGSYSFASNVLITFWQPKGTINMVLSDIQLNRALTSPMRIVKPKSYELINVEQ